jgi:uncharacterized membrane protein YobD (UPF0266 family)
MPAPADEWAPRWSELRKRGRRDWLLFFALVAVLVAAHAFGLPEFTSVLLAGPALLWIVVDNWRRKDILCPRCGKRFFTKRVLVVFAGTDASRRACAHCGLKKYAPSYES